MEVGMATRSVQRPDSPESKSDASASGPGIAPATPNVSESPGVVERISKRADEIAQERGFASGHEREDWLRAEREIEWGTPRNTPPDNPFDDVRTSSNE
jgi:hypothetical protein